LIFDAICNLLWKHFSRYPVDHKACMIDQVAL
jgi:hypothetical protein